MTMAGFEMLMQCAHTMRKIMGESQGYAFVFAKGDHEKAHKQWPLALEDELKIVSFAWDETIAETGGSPFIPIWSSPFGACAAHRERAIWTFWRPDGTSEIIEETQDVSHTPRPAIFGNMATTWSQPAHAEFKNAGLKF